MEEMYEVLKFIEHGGQCRQSLDCVQGTILLSYLRDAPSVEKETLFRWFRELAVCVDQFHRCRKGQDFRCLNPYSIVVTVEGRIMLLDMDAPDNSAAARQMQKGAVREHFVKPVYRIGVSRNNEADLFTFGKTIQFMLACTEVTPSLSRWEEVRLERLIGRCIGEKKKGYEDMRQVISDLPAVPGRRRRADFWGSQVGRAGKALSVLALGAAAVLLLWAAPGIGSSGDPGVSDREGASVNTDETSGEVGAGAALVNAAAVETSDQILPDISRTSVEDDEDAGRIAAAAVMLAAETERHHGIYERIRLEAELILAWGRLTELEQDQAEIEKAGVRKMELEAGRGDYSAAVQTGEKVLEKIENSEKIAEMIKKYEGKNNDVPSPVGEETS
ncbi:MAG TPA: hypothetical protein H9722_10700 [Candidatus Mediterraneibacter pullistercoris]|nr:hypothetical protein [Candidatus Mediterraneibacter pullistercoris]